MGNGNTAVVTGGGSGIGLAVAGALTAGGFRVVAIGRRPPSLLPDWLSLSTEYPGQLEYKQADLGSSDDTERVGRELLAYAPAVLVHAAGQFAAVDPANGRDQRGALARLCDLHAGAGVQLAIMLGGGMKAGGHVVFIVSNATIRVSRGLLAYAASKAAAETAVKYLAIALGPNVSVNAIAPGLVDTALSRAAGATEVSRREVANRTPLGRLATTGDVARAVERLVASPGVFTSGQTLLVDGGNSLVW